ncbi:uncharacterized protein LOC142233127 [Haematobia irritans]|uniref:uncharacterized protein LOC142233127 n=1 Tax=Haematobia irritans TaxID=7368 RepID=UPI003F4FD942
MSTNVPTISITSHHHSTSSSSDSDSDTSNSHDNDMNYSKRLGNLTDVEDFDSQADVSNASSRRASINGRTQTNNDLTDVEDYEASDSEFDVGVFPEIKLSLEEFLTQGIQGHQTVTNGTNERVERRSGNFLKAQNLNNANDYLTDCEDYNTDSEVEIDVVKSVCVDLNEEFVEHGEMNIVDASGTPYSIDDSNEDVSIASNISDLVSDATGACALPGQVLSEDELLEISGDEEICNIPISDSESTHLDDKASDDDPLSLSSAAPLNVKFIAPLETIKSTKEKLTRVSVSNRTSHGVFLAVQREKEEVLTDIENLDEDDDSFDDDDKPIPQAVILTPDNNGDSQTDCEDISCDEIGSFETSGPPNQFTVDLKNLPQPQREVVLLQENKYGDTITSVMPMDQQHKFGISTCSMEECVTDCEEYSFVEGDDLADLSVAEAPLPSSNDLMESDITVSNEQMKPQLSKRLEIQSNTESVTDVEEFYVDGTNTRKKKQKSRTIGKNKVKYLDLPKPTEDGNTDVEEMDLSEADLPSDLKPQPIPNLSDNNSPTQIDKATDVEDLTTDDLSSTSETDFPQINRNSSNLKDYDNSSSNIVTAMETHPSVPSRSIHIKKTIVQQVCNIHQQQQTDTEDVQLPSDNEDFCARELPSTCLSSELTEMLNGACTTVHEKCQNSFNVDVEKLQIKGMLREAHTDIEYVESDESAARGSK